MSSQMTLWDTGDAISSEELADGSLPSISPDGTGLAGPDRVRVNLSHQPARGAERTMNAICGRSFFDSSTPSDRLASLASKSLLAMDCFGSMVYSLTWKVRVTPAGRRICALRASGRTTSDNGCFGWHSPTVEDHKTDGPLTMARYETSIATGVPPPTSAQRLRNQVQALTGRNTPRATDGSKGGPNQSGGALPADAAMTAPGPLAGWPTCAATDGTKAPPDHHGRSLTLVGAALASSPAATASCGVLDAAFSRWLMGFPRRWDEQSPGYAAWREVQDAIASDD